MLDLLRAASRNDQPLSRAEPRANPVEPRGTALRRHLRRWGAYWLAAGALLAASEALWWWQTWPVRALLPDAVQAAPGP